MSQTLLSLVLSGKRPFTVKQATQASVLLGLTQEESARLLDSTLMSLPSNSRGLGRLKQARAAASKETLPLFRDHQIDRFKAIATWYHTAILDLTTTRNFRASPRWIAERLGISTIEAHDAVERLVSLGLLVRDSQGLRKPESKIYFATDRSEPAVRNFHKQMMEKAQAALSSNSPGEFERREISGMTIAVHVDRLPDAKKRIQKFQRELAAFLNEGDCDEVFQLNVQFFPLTRSSK